MSEEISNDSGIRDRVQAKGGQAIGDLAEALLENPVFNQALSAAFGAREKAQVAQQAAMGALSLPSISDVERLERRIRVANDRIEDAERQIDRMGREIAELRTGLAVQAEAAKPAKPAKAPRASRSRKA